MPHHLFLNGLHSQVSFETDVALKQYRGFSVVCGTRTTELTRALAINHSQIITWQVVSECFWFTNNFPYTCFANFRRWLGSLENHLLQGMCFWPTSFSALLCRVVLSGLAAGVQIWCNSCGCRSSWMVLLLNEDRRKNLWTLCCPPKGNMLFQKLTPEQRQIDALPVVGEASWCLFFFLQRMWELCSRFFFFDWEGFCVGNWDFMELLILVFWTKRESREWSHGTSMI